MTVKIEQDGKTYEFRGEYRIPDSGDYWLSNDPTNQDGNIFEGHFIESRAILYLIPVVPEVFEFGDAQFVKTGEIRSPNVGEWYLSEGEDVPLFCSVSCTMQFITSKRIILKAYHPKPFETYFAAKTKEVTEEEVSIYLKASTVEKIKKLQYIPTGGFKLNEIVQEVIDACKKVNKNY